MLESIKNWWHKLTAQWAEDRLYRLNRQLYRDSASTFQLMEFNGDVYISYNGVPIVSTQNLTLQAVEVLDASRRKWIEFKLHELGFDKPHDNEQGTESKV